MSTVPAEAESTSGLLRTTGSMVLPTLVSRVTGFAKVAALGYVIGLKAASSSFNLANTLPTIIAELVLGAVLTSVVVPVLVRAEREDADHGVVFTRRLLTTAGVLLLITTAAALITAPLLTAVYLGPNSQADPTLATLFAFLLLPQIFFYGYSALFGAILNTRGVFGLVAWAPVVNNLVTLLTLAVYALLPGTLQASLTNPQLLVLGIGTTLGIVAQAAVVIPALRRCGVALRPQWGLDARLRRFGGMAVAAVGYVLVSQVGLAVTYRVASAADESGIALFGNAWLLLQVPYGIIGVSLLTAIMPRMSRAAAAGDHRGVLADLSLGSRLSTVSLVPIIALFTVYGSTLGVALFGYGAADPETAGRLGATVAASAFGLLPFAIVLLQLRVFYARQQAWIPTAVNGFMVALRVPLMLLTPAVLAPQNVVLGLAAVHGVSFLAGSLAGAVLLRRQLGALDTRALLRTVALVTLASLAGLAVDRGLSVTLGLHRLGDTLGSVGAAIEFAVHAVIVLGVTAAVMLALRLPELAPVMPALSTLRGRLGATPSSSPARARTATILPYPGAISTGDHERGGGRAVSAQQNSPETSSVAAPTEAIPTAATPTEAVGVAPRGPVRGPRLVPGAAVAGGRYRLLVSHGGAGALRFWQARDTTLDRDVALTFVDAGQSGVGADPEAEGPQAVLSRTRRLGGLDTPGLARVLDVVRGSSGGIVVSEWTTGRSLREVAESTPSPVGAANAVRTLAAAAEAAHRAGTSLAIDHPDRVRISSSGAAVLAFPGVTAGADQRGDVQGLGAVLYALLTARWPLPAPGVGESVEPVGAMARAPLGRAGTAVEPRTLRSDVPFEISAVAMRALQPDSGLRTAAAVQTVLDQAAVLDQRTDMFPAVRADDAAQDSDRTQAFDDRAAPPPRGPRFLTRSRKLILGVLTLVVVAVLVLGYAGTQLASVFGTGQPATKLPSLQLGPTSAPVPGPGAAPAPAPAPAPQAAGPVTVTGASVFSPGGAADHPGDVGRALDGNPATVWPTDQYLQQFPRLKNGVGLLLTLAGPTTLSNVSIDSPSPGTVVEIRTSPNPNPQLDQTAVVGTTTLAGGRSEIPVKVSTPVQYVLVWITRLSTAGGTNQSDIGDIALRS